MTADQEYELQESYFDLEELMRKEDEDYPIFRDGFLQCCYALMDEEKRRKIFRFVMICREIEESEEE